MSFVLISGFHHCFCSENSSFLPRMLLPSIPRPPSPSAGQVCPLPTSSPSSHFTPSCHLTPPNNASAPTFHPVLTRAAHVVAGSATRYYTIPIRLRVQWGLDTRPFLHCPYLPWVLSMPSPPCPRPNDKVSGSRVVLQSVGCGAHCLCSVPPPPTLAL